MIDLKAWRTGHGMTQQQAADALGIGNSTVRAIEAGTREMTATLSLACHGWDATHGHHEPRTSCDEPVAEQLVPASVEARLNAHEARLSAIEATLGKAAARNAMRQVPDVEQRTADYCTPAEIAACTAADVEDGIPEGTTLREREAMIRKGIMPKPLSKPDAIVQTQQPSDGSRPWGTYRPPEPTPEQEQAAKDRRAAAKARTIAAGEPWD